MTGDNPTSTTDHAPGPDVEPLSVDAAAGLAGDVVENTERVIVGKPEAVEHLVAQRYRPRRPGETWRAYVVAFDDGRRAAGDQPRRAAALFRLGERAKYADRATERDAREAVRLLSALRAEPGRIG